MQRYQDRTEAGWRLAVNFTEYFKHPGVLVLAISRGGVPVAYEIAQALSAELGVFPFDDNQTAPADSAESLGKSWMATHLNDRTVILVDDGLSVPVNIIAAARAARLQGPKKLIIAIPIVSSANLMEFRSEADQIVCSVSPKPFQARGFLYEKEAEPGDQEIRSLIERAARRQEMVSHSRVSKR